MKITCKLPPFHFVHDGNEEFDLGDKPVEVSDAAYEHLCQVFGKDSFAVADEPLPKGSSEASSEENTEPAVEPKHRGRPKKL